MNEFKINDIIIINEVVMQKLTKSFIGKIYNIEKHENGYLMYGIIDINGHCFNLKNTFIEPIDYDKLVIIVSNKDEYIDIAQILGIKEPYDENNLIYPDLRIKGYTDKNKMNYITYINTAYGKRICIDYNEFIQFIKYYYTEIKPYKEICENCINWTEEYFDIGINKNGIVSRSTQYGKCIYIKDSKFFKDFTCENIFKLFKKKQWM